MTDQYDASKLKTPAECRTVMERAKAKNLPHVYQAALLRYCELAGQKHEDASDPMIRDFYVMLAAYEQCLTEKNGRNTAATRTRRMVSDKGVYQTILHLSSRDAETMGFRLLVEANLAKLTTEYIVAKYADRFPVDVVERARRKLLENKITLSS